MEGSGATIGVLYLGYRGPLVTAYYSGYDHFPPVANGWGTTHPIPDMAPQHLVEEQGPPT
jgi:hypothetical protein